MGKSHSIQQQQERNKEFNEYITQINEDLDKRKDVLEQQLSKMEQEHYSNISDKAMLIEGKYHHLTTTSEWSLDSVNEIINACSKAIFGSKEPSGSEKSGTGEEVAASIKAIKERELYIASAAFDIVQSIIGTFKNSTKTSLEQKLDGKPIAPGMTLFVGVENNTYSNKKFFESETIIQTIFVFRVCYSIIEGAKQSALSDLELYEDQKTTFRSKIEQLNKMIEELDVTSENYDAEFIRYMNRADLMNDRLTAITKKIKQLSNNKIDKEQELCNNIIKNMRNSRIFLKSNVKTYEIRSTPFTYTGSTDDAINYIRRWIPGYAHLSYLEATDYSNNHYIAVFSSRNSNIDTSDVDRWVSKGLDGKNDFRFD